MEVDTYGILKSQPRLKFQVVTREKKLREIEPRLVRNPGKQICIDLDLKNWISGAIQLKESKHYSNQNELILLIVGDIGPLLNEDYAKRIFGPFKNSNFKGIYSVHLPSDSHNGQIIAIKDIFGEHGRSF